MVNHFYDETARATRCRDDFIGESAPYVSSNTRVSCPECRALLTPDERADQWYPFTTEEPTDD